MLTSRADRVRNRLGQFVEEIDLACASRLSYYDRLRDLVAFCRGTTAINAILRSLPAVPFLSADLDDFAGVFPTGAAQWAQRWSALQRIADDGPDALVAFWLNLSGDEPEGLRMLTDAFVIPLHHYLIDQLQSGSDMAYILLRYKRWAEWFQAPQLRQEYGAGATGGERALDRSLRRFLFESGIDYPFSEPASPRGKADVVAGLETDDPLVLEVKVWDSQKGYRENRVRDGLRQVMKYTADYGKDRGYVVVFNLDQEPLSFVGSDPLDEWPPCLEHGSKSYLFIDVNIGEQSVPVSQQDKGRPVRANSIALVGLLSDE